jgi:hypothetical protein
LEKRKKISAMWLIFSNVFFQTRKEKLQRLLNFHYYYFCRMFFILFFFIIISVDLKLSARPASFS